MLKKDFNLLLVHQAPLCSSLHSLYCYPRLTGLCSPASFRPHGSCPSPFHQYSVQEGQRAPLARKAKLQVILPQRGVQQETL